MKTLTNKAGDVRELTAEDFEEFKPTSEILPELTNAKSISVRSVGRPKSTNPKQAINIRLDEEVLAYFKQTGKGWQSRINQTLRQHIGR